VHHSSYHLLTTFIKSRKQGISERTMEFHKAPLG
jgi:hypothetical protein